MNSPFHIFTIKDDMPVQYSLKLKSLPFLIYILLLSVAATSCHSEENKSEQTFQQFWSEFRTAALDNNLTRITELTHFPFIVKGDLDMDGSIHLDRIAFQKKFKLFMEQDIRENLTPESMRTYIKKHKNISPRIDDGQTSVALFSFEKINGKWYFVRVYVEQF